mmetsp:Transcript_9417/g.20462  ORF Transcript_9417/g.20462 Transcript_9417/m.20462 type:complete len:431 (+) Transcript_9417:206-1498(+)
MILPLAYLVPPPLVSHPAVALGPHHHGLVVDVRHGLGDHLHLELAEQHAQDRLDLHEGEVLPHAAVHAAAEAHVGIGAALVLLAPGPEPVGVERVGILEDLGDAHSHRRADEHHVPLGDGVVLPGRADLDLLERLADQQDEGRAQPQRLLHGVVQEGHALVDHLVVHGGVRVGGEDALLLLVDALHDGGVVEYEQAGPGGGDAARVLSGEEQRDEQSRDLLVRDGRPVLVLDVHEDAQDFRTVGVLRVRVVASVLDHLAEQLHHLAPRGVALPVGGGGGVGEEDGERRQALVEVVVQLGHLLEEVLAHVVAVEAAAGGEDGELGQGVEEVQLAAVAPGLEVLPGLPLDLGGVALEAGRAQAVGHGLELDLAVLLGGVVDDARAEDGLHEAVDLVLGEDLGGRHGTTGRRRCCRPTRRRSLAAGRAALRRA